MYLSPDRCLSRVMIKTKIGRAAGFGAAEAAPLAVLRD
jgi:hypothetical protein